VVAARLATCSPTWFPKSPIGSTKVRNFLRARVAPGQTKKEVIDQRMTELAGIPQIPQSPTSGNVLIIGGGLFRPVHGHQAFSKPA